MGKFEIELVNDTVNANRPTDKLEVCVCGVVEDEVVPVKNRQPRPANTTSQLFPTGLC